MAMLLRMAERGYRITSKRVNYTPDDVIGSECVVTWAHESILYPDLSKGECARGVCVPVSVCKGVCVSVSVQGCLRVCECVRV